VSAPDRDATLTFTGLLRLLESLRRDGQQHRGRLCGERESVSGGKRGKKRKVTQSRLQLYGGQLSLSREISLSWTYA
jgi:hypothetical protein